MSGTYWCQIFDSRFLSHHSALPLGSIFIYTPIAFPLRFYFCFITEFVLELYGILSREVKLEPNILFHLKSGQHSSLFLLQVYKYSSHHVMQSNTKPLNTYGSQQRDLCLLLFIFQKLQGFVHGTVFRALANIQDGVFWRKWLKGSSLLLLLQNTPSQMSDRVLNTPLDTQGYQQQLRTLFSAVFVGSEKNF